MSCALFKARPCLLGAGRFVPSQNKRELLLVSGGCTMQAVSPNSQVGHQVTRMLLAGLWLLWDWHGALTRTSQGQEQSSQLFRAHLERSLWKPAYSSAKGTQEAPRGVHTWSHLAVTHTEHLHGSSPMEDTHVGLHPRSASSSAEDIASHKF